jgi:hypothetical protein
MNDPIQQKQQRQQQPQQLQPQQLQPQLQPQQQIPKVTPVPNPRCPNGHSLILTGMLPPRYVQNTCGCDRCQSKFVVTQQNQVWHCEMCSFDLCRKCAIKNQSYNPQMGQIASQGINNQMPINGYGIDPLMANFIANLTNLTKM